MKKHVGKLLLSMLAGACIVFATVVTDYDHAVDFHKYKTYSWIKVKVDDPLWEDRITRAIDTQLVAKGWGKVPMNGDAAVAAFGSVHEKKTLETWYSGFGGGWRWHGLPSVSRQGHVDWRALRKCGRRDRDAGALRLRGGELLGGAGLVLTGGPGATVHESRTTRHRRGSALRP